MKALASLFLAVVMMGSVVSAGEFDGVKEQKTSFVVVRDFAVKAELFPIAKSLKFKSKENGKTCREQGAILTYNKRLQEKSAYAEYRKIYQQKFMKVRKNKDNKKIANDFESWKKQAKEKITKLKHEELSEKEVYEWIMKNK